MTSDPKNPFGDLETDFKKAEKAKNFSGGRLPVHHSYKGVCVAFNPEGLEDGELVDKHFFVTPGGTKAVKIMIEILDPEKVGDEEVKGKNFEHVFWVTAPNEKSGGTMPQIKRDVSVILRKEIVELKELLTSVWAGRTVEFGVRDDSYNGFVNSKVTHFNPWSPEVPEKGEKSSDKKKGAAANAKKGAAANAKKGAVPEEEIAF
jgi:hypothetical protein